MNFHYRELIVENDLEWFFCRSDSDIGIKSNWQAMVNVSIYGEATSFNDPNSSFILDSANRKSSIHNILRCVSIKNKDVLYYSFSSIKHNPSVEKVFTKYTGAAYLNTIVPPQQLFELAHRINVNKATDKEKLLVTKILMEAKINYKSAIDTYFNSKCKQLKENNATDTY